jgi:hypothetical protein
MDETNGNDIHVLAAQLLELVERLQTAEDAIMNLHSRLVLAEQCIVRERDAMKQMVEALEWLLRRVGGRPGPPLHGVN